VGLAVWHHNGDHGQDRQVRHVGQLVDDGSDGRDVTRRRSREQVG